MRHPPIDAFEKITKLRGRDRRRLEVWWPGPNKRKSTYLVVINGSSTRVGPNGLHLGLSLRDLENNRKPFTLMGFDKNNITMVSDWDEGKLSVLPGGCKAGISLHPDPNDTADTLAALPTDRES